MSSKIFFGKDIFEYSLRVTKVTQQNFCVWTLYICGFINLSLFSYFIYIYLIKFY